ncbi:hypothetical protein ACI8AC_02485 [Geodermatophilus sp. SYSU D00758]
MEASINPGAVHAWLYLRAAINLRRLLTLGLTGTDGHWALAS